LPEDAPERTPLLLPFARLLYVMGEMADANAALSAVIERGDRDLSARALFVQSWMGTHFEGSDFTESEMQVRALLEELEQSGADDRTLAEGHNAHGHLLFWLGRTTEAGEAGRHAREYAVRAGDAMLEVEAITRIGVGLAYGTSRWEEVEEHARGALSEVGRLGRGMLKAQLGLANALWARGDFEEARRIQAAFRADVGEQGGSFGGAGFAQHSVVLELVAEDFERAEAEARAAWDELGRLGERGYRSTTGALLSEALVELGRLDEAAQIVEEAASLSTPDDWLTVVHCNWARALAASVVGEHDRAVELARAAVEFADQHEYYLTRTHYWFGLSRVLVAAGRCDEARAAIAETRRLSDIKGTTAYDGRLSLLEEQLAAPA
jgi:tetratricopeptide (TPR) repeat protein